MDRSMAHQLFDALTGEFVDRLGDVHLRELHGELRVEIVMEHALDGAEVEVLVRIGKDHGASVKLGMDGTVTFV
jgi:hypothetical protein